MDTPNSIPAAWYDDPAGSGGQRWWDGVAWSEHVRPSEAPVFPVVQTYQPVQPAQPYQQVQQYPSAQPYQPAQSVQPYQPVLPATSTGASAVYNPFQGQASAAPTWYGDASREPVVVNNSAGWTSLVAGIIGLGVVVVSSMLGSTIYVLYFPLVVAVVLGIRSLVQRASGTSTSLVAPILGILFGVVAAGMFLSVVVTGALPFTTPPSGFDAASNNERFPSNPELAAMYTTAYDIQLGMHEQFPEGNWPDTVASDASGEIAVYGVKLGTIAPGQRFHYALIDPGHFSFTIWGTISGERVEYDSVENSLIVRCYNTDSLCQMVDVD